MNFTASAQTDADLLYRSLFDKAPVGHALNRFQDGRFLEVNQAFCELTGYSHDELRQLSYLDITAPEYTEAEQHRQQVLRDQRHYSAFEKEYIHKNGQRVHVRLHGSMITNQNGEDLVLSVVEDISHEREQRDTLRLYETVFRASRDAILITDRHIRIVAVNPAFCEMTGYTLTDVYGQNPKVLASGKSSREDYERMWAALHDKGAWQGEIWDRRKDGSIYPKWMSISVAHAQDGQVTHYIASFTDITERRETADRLYHLAHHDSLTGLPNRAGLLSKLEHAIHNARRHNTQLAVLFIDMDRFKTVNDTLGHPVGDGLLIAIANRLHETVRSSDIVARLGGDEFVVVLLDIERALSVSGVVSKIQRNLADSYRIGEHDLYSTPSIGISLFPVDGEDVDTLMRNADTAMYHAKNQGRNNYQFFANSMNEAAHERLRMENALHQALESTPFGNAEKASQLHLHFQPQFHALTGHVITVEALARWDHPEMGVIPPSKFIPIAEETGLIQPLGDWVFWEACRQMRELKDQGFHDVRVAVNLSAQQLRQDSLPTVVRGALTCYDLDPKDLELEITESVAMQNPATTIKMLDELQGMGIVLSIDDFGTGYSSLSYLKYLPIHRLKLDRTFIKNLERNPDDVAICSATVALGHHLGLEIVAEGVETEGQYLILKDMGCDVIQGFLYCYPLPLPALVDFLREHRRQG